MRMDKTTSSDKHNLITDKLNQSLREVLLIEQKISVIENVKPEVVIGFGVTIKISGDINGIALVEARKEVFQMICEEMFGWKLSDWMLSSFAGEITNMITGYFTTELSKVALSTYLQDPKIIERNAIDFADGTVIHLLAEIKDMGEMNVYLILD